MGEGAEGDAADAPRAHRHTLAQWLVLCVNIVIVVGCVAAAVVLLVAKHAAEQTNRVSLARFEETTTVAPVTTPPRHVESTDAPAVSVDESVAATEPTTTSEPTTTTTTLPRPRFEGENYLVVGIDNNACIDPNSPYAGGIGDRTARLTDTIMMIRVVPSTRHAALLSFPRDLWVRVNGSMRRINTAYRRNDPTALRNTLHDEFGIDIDHFIAVDFCAFMGIVDALGGITVPLPHAIRDTGIGLSVESAGCHTVAGDEALAYVRSRHLDYLTDTGEWKRDQSSDFGRIARQQDFVRRVLTAAKQNLLDPAVIESLYTSYTHHLVIDDSLTIAKIAELADILRDVDPAVSRSYQFDVTGTKISGQSVLLVKKTANMNAILDVFRGFAPIGEGDAVLPVIAGDGSVDTAVTTTVPAAQPTPNGPRGAVVPESAEQC